VRYETGVPIGSGGMGTVIRSYDPVLDRHVALKLLRGDDPELAERMLREARAQAAVDHPNVAKVYEVGYLEDGRPFIAMQLIEGKPLNEVARRLTLDQKIGLLATVAEAVQAAHATGLVHRDLKPSNILVEESSGLGLVPYVVDFGIAREEAAPGFTVSGQVLGTPGYMAPEQASGAVLSLDRRADIFSLGVILYELVSGSHPFKGDNPVEKLLSLFHDEPLPLRTGTRQVPADLEAVIFKCLDKRPDHRYASARALAEELRRYLAGEPVLARRVTRLGILWRRAKRHPVMTATVAAAILAMAVAAGVTFTSVATSRRQTKEAHELGQRVSRAEAAMRVAHLLPPHDLSREKALVRQEMSVVRRDMGRFRRGARAAGHYALGRGHLALGEPAEARRELEQAWQMGFRTSEVALALAQAHAELLRARLDRVRRQQDEDARKVGLALADRELRQPAERFLAAVGGEHSHEVLLVQGLLELAAREPTGAQRRADELSALDPGSAELAARADGMRGEAYLQQAMELRWGADHERHQQMLEQAREAFERAVGTLRSEPTLHLGLCRAWVGMAEKEADTGLSPVGSLARAEETCGLAMRVDPSQAGPLLKLGSAHLTLAQFWLRRGSEPAAPLDRATELAQHALRIDPSSYEAVTIEGTALMLRAEWQYERPSVSAKLLSEAIVMFGRAQELDPSRPEAFHLQGNALLTLVDHQNTMGEDPAATIGAALAAFEKALALPEGRTHRIFNSLAVAYTNLGWMQRLRGEDPRESLRKGIEAVDQAISMSPDYLTALNSRGLALWELAEYAAATGADPLSDFQRAEEAFGRMIALDPSRMVAHTNSAGVLLGKARWQLLQGIDPGASLAAVEVHLAAARERSFWDFNLDTAEVELVRAAWVGRSGGQGADAHLEKARHYATVLVGLAPDEPSGEMLLAEVERSWVEMELGAGPNDRRAIDVACRRGLEHAARALAISPKLARAHAVRAVLLAAQAELARDPEHRRDLAARAREAARAAVAAEPLLRDEVVHRLAAT